MSGAWSFQHGEQSVAERKRRVTSNAYKFNKKVILSYHNFKKTPKNSQLLKLLKDSLHYDPFLTKLAVFASNDADFLRLLNFCKMHSKSSNTAIIPMGHLSRFGRAICPILGSYLAYGYINTPVVANQLSLKQLKSVLG